MKIPFNRPYMVGNELQYISEAMASGCVSCNGPFTKHVQTMLEEQLEGTERVILTTSCTHALEVAAILLDLEPGDEVIVPSFTFVSTALAFAMHGANIIFADIRPDTQNIDESVLENLVTEKTRAIVPVHYAGVGCNMDAIMEIANKYDLVVIEDNAHGLYGKYKGRYLGTIGHLATLSFHETKNIICGEGGALIVNNRKFMERAEIIRDKGTNRARFFRKQVDKYTWVDKGSSYGMSDILAAFLYGQLLGAQEIQASRRYAWDFYFVQLVDWCNQNNVQMPFVPDCCEQAFHMFYLIMPDLSVRTRFIRFLNEKGINVVFHYQPLHNSDMGAGFSNQKSRCTTTQKISDRLVRLPFFNFIPKDMLYTVVETVKSFKA